MPQTPTQTRTRAPREDQKPQQDFRCRLTINTANSPLLRVRLRTENNVHLLFYTLLYYMDLLQQVCIVSVSEYHPLTLCKSFILNLVFKFRLFPMDNNVQDSESQHGLKRYYKLGDDIIHGLNRGCS